MTRDELSAALDRLKLTPSEAAQRLGIDRATLWKYLASKLAIPGPVAEAVRSWEQIAQLQGGRTA